MNNKDKYSELIKQKIEKFVDKNIYSTDGHVLSINDGIAMVSGLDDVCLNEIVKFENNSFGLTLNLEENMVGVFVLGKYEDIKEKSKVYRTKKIISTIVGNDVLGRVINPLGTAIDDMGEISNKKIEVIEKNAPTIIQRSQVNTPLETGTIIIDAMFPIGKGQRELIIGDRQTGKTTLAINAIINQKNKNVKCVYVSIGQKNSSLVQIIKKLTVEDCMKFTTIVSANASDLPIFKYIAPYSGMTIAEEWAKKGENVLIIFDDLTKHAESYRAVSLLLKRAPGREAYPGDIFYLHSRLLERACKLNNENGGGSITALPIIQTQNSDISSYIPTNVISITDGQIFLQPTLFNLGQRPAIDIGLSVSRVGSTAQYKTLKYVSSNIKILLSQYYDLLTFTQFGNEIDKSTIEVIEKGKKINEIIKQNTNEIYEWYDEVFLLNIIKKNYLKYLPLQNIQTFKTFFLDHIKNESSYRELMKNNSLKDKEFEKIDSTCIKLIKIFVQKLHIYDEVLLNELKGTK